MSPCASHSQAARGLLLLPADGCRVSHRSARAFWMPSPGCRWAELLLYVWEGNARPQPKLRSPSKCVWKGHLCQSQCIHLGKDRHFPVVPSPAQLLASLQSCEGVSSAGQSEISPLEFVFPVQIPSSYYFCPISKAQRTAVPCLSEKWDRGTCETNDPRIISLTH